MAVIGINYGGGNTYDDDDNMVINNIVYESVYLHTREENFTFNSGNFVKDWFNAKKKYVELQDKEPYLSGSSTCNHFISDGAKFDSAYLHVVDGKPILRYIDYNDESWLENQRDIFEKGWEFFVDEGTQPTWEELKEITKIQNT